MTKVSHFRRIKIYAFTLAKINWATFLAIFSQTHLVTMLVSRSKSLKRLERLET
jgi:hypothetical protein